MEITPNKINGANAEISATVFKATIDANVDKLAKDLSKQANIPGFRKGKVPVSAVKRQYGERLVQDAESEAFREVLDRGLEMMQIAQDALIGEPQISNMNRSDDKIDVTVRVAMRPAIELGDYKSHVKPFDKPQVSDEEVTARIEELAVAQAPQIDVEDPEYALQDGETAVIDFEGFKDGEPFEGGKAEEFALKIGSGNFIPGFEEQLVGMKKGEERTIDVTFPESYGNADLAGQPVQFKVKLHKIQVKEAITFDDALAAKMLPGVEEATMEMLRQRVKEQLESEAFNKLYNDKLKAELLEAIVEAYSFDLPDFVVEQEIDLALNNKAREMTPEEIEAVQQDADKLKELRESFRNDSSRSVKATFIIDALAKAEGINVSEQEVMQTIYYEAMQMQQDPQQLFERYKDTGYLPAIQMSMVEDRVLSKLLTDVMSEGGA